MFKEKFKMLKIKTIKSEKFIPKHIEVLIATTIPVVWESVQKILT